MKRPIINKKELRPWVLKYYYISRPIAILWIPFVALTHTVILIVEGWGNVTKECKDQWKVAIGKWEDKQ